MKVGQLLDEIDKEVRALKIYQEDGQEKQIFWASNVRHSTERAHKLLKIIHDKYAKDLGYDEDEIR